MQRLREGDMVEVHEWPRQQEANTQASRLVHMRARVKSSGALGWLTAIDRKGVGHAEMLT